jgi:EAL domain-containing protein (putative c-di-GMP-specific phosphodiesterase class I)/CheY-like chemotaxis protein
MVTKPKVLIVDDIQVNRISIILSLKKEGYHFFEASNGIEAIQKAKEIIPDIILMDALMPKMDGFEATRKIREIEEIQRVPILMITSLDHKEDKIKAIGTGINDFISKPFDKLELKARCKSYVEINNLNKKYTLATKNPVTNYPNKTALLKEIKNLQTTRELFLIKIDNFDMNENFYGTKIVKNLEIEFIKSLKNYKDKIGQYSIYHISSGKYALLLNEYSMLNSSLIEEFCTTLSEDIKKRKYTHDEYHFDVNATISFASGKTSLYEDANIVLTAAMNQRKNFLLSYDVIDSIKENLRENLDMLKVIKIALKNDKILPFFQPIFNINENKTTKYEALIRMYDEQNNLIAPGPYFLDVAKKGKLYSQVTKILFQKVIEKIREQRCEISINISSLDIEDQQMSEYLLKLLKENSDITHMMTFELFEDKDTQDYAYVNKFIDKVRKLGIKIAIDDFGSGYSNFIRIIEFKPDIIKIDGSLIENIAQSESNKKTVEAIKIFAQKIGAQTVAEYVTNERTFDIVKELGIDYAQGFYIGKPKPEFVDEKELEPA